MYHGSELLGYFGSVSTPAVIIQAGCSFIYTPLVAPLSSRFARGDLRDFRRMLLLALGGVLGFAACMFAGAALLGRWGLTLLFGQAILPYAFLLLPVLGSTLCISLIYFFEVPLTIGRRLKVMTAIRGGAVVVAAAVSLLAIPARGVAGGAAGAVRQRRLRRAGHGRGYGPGCAARQKRPPETGDRGKVAFQGHGQGSIQASLSRGASFA